MGLPDDFEFQRAEAEKRVRDMNRLYNEKINKYTKTAAEPKNDICKNEVKKSVLSDTSGDTLLLICIIFLLLGEKDNGYLALALLYIML